MFGGMPEHPTGLGMSVLRRAEALAKASVSTEILIDKFYCDYDRHTSRLMDRLEDLITFRSLHHDLAGQSVYPADVEYTAPLGTGEAWDYVQDNKNAEVQRGYEGGEYKHFVWWRGQKVNFIDHMRGRTRLRREWHDEAGAVCKVEMMNADNKTEVIRYIRRDGTCYMEEIVDPGSGRVRGYRGQPPRRREPVLPRLRRSLRVLDARVRASGRRHPCHHLRVRNEA